MPGIYTDWSTVQAQVKVSGAKHKSFATRHEAQTWLDENKRDHSVPISLHGDLSETSSMAPSKERQTVELSLKKQKKNNGLAAPALTNGNVVYEPGYGPLPADAEDGFDRTLKLDLDSGAIRLRTEGELNLTRRQPTGDFTGPIKVYTDGSSLSNGKTGAVAGVGVYFGPNDPRLVLGVILISSLLMCPGMFLKPCVGKSRLINVPSWSPSPEHWTTFPSTATSSS